MIDKQYSSFISYKSAMAQAKLMYSKGIVVIAEEYEIIETKMCENLVSIRAVYFGIMSG